jgi:dihydrofolate synthase/folylpolyglutamate synthase
MGDNHVQWLYGLQQFGIKLGLDNIRALLAKLGRPETRFPSIVVGGTNGKGSVCAMLEAMLLASGAATGLYTSPHLVRPHERIRLRGRDIDSGALERHLAEVRRAVEEGVRDGSLDAHPSFFEVITATALLAFRQAAVDAAVVEVGLGGRLDATNVVPARASAIVTIDLDHTDRLGESIAQIAWEKAGIIKRGQTVVTGVTQAEPLEALRRTCETVGATLIEARSAARLANDDEPAFTIDTARGRYADLWLPLPGHHQIQNARVAVLAFEVFADAIGLGVSPDAIRSGLGSVRWPGRLQWIAGDPPLLLDGAHNPAGAETLAAYLAARKGLRPVLVFAAMANKEPRGILSPLGAVADTVILTRPPVDRAADPTQLRDIAESLFKRVEVEPSPGAALARARSLAGNSFVVVAGSLYLVGAVLGLLEGGEGPGPVAM